MQLHHISTWVALTGIALHGVACGDDGGGAGGGAGGATGTGDSGATVSGASSSLASGATCAGSTPSTDLDAEEMSHACGHIEDGPFGDIDDGETLGNIHMVYTLRLTPNEAGGFAGTFPFTARADATHVFLAVDAEVPLRFEVSGEERCQAASTPSGCDGIFGASFVDLAEGETVTLAVGPVATETVRLLGERH